MSQVQFRVDKKPFSPAVIRGGGASLVRRWARLTCSRTTVGSWLFGLRPTILEPREVAFPPCEGAIDIRVFVRSSQVSDTRAMLGTSVYTSTSEAQPR